MKRHFILILIIMALASLQAGAHKPSVPIAQMQASQNEIHGVLLKDSWAWTRDREDPRLPKVIKAEDKYAQSCLKKSKKLAKSLYREYKSRIPKNHESAHALYQGYYSFSRQNDHQEHSVYYRLKDTPGASEEVLLDVNKLAKGKKFLDLGFLSSSPDNKLLAYTTDETGAEVYSLWIKDLKTGEVSDTGLDHISDFIWQTDNRHAIIVLDNDIMRSNRCLRLDTRTGATELLYQEDDPAFNLGLYRWGDRSTIFLQASSKTGSENWYLATADLEGGFKPVSGRRTGIKYSCAILGDELYLFTNRWNRDYSIARCNIADPAWENWQELIAPPPGSALQDFSLFTDKIVCVMMSAGSNTISIHRRSDGKQTDAIIPDEPCDMGLWNNPEPTAFEFSYYQESWLVPYRIYIRGFEESHARLYYQEPLPKKYNPQLYESKSISYPSRDGASIPLTLIQRKDLGTGTHPVWLSGYGAYGDIESPWFSSSRQSILDRGVIIAQAHVRGGGEMGKAWHDAGRLLNKKNSFYDFVDGIQYLIDSGISSPQQILIEGGSAGGLLMGAVTNLAPSLVKAVIADVPFVDLVNTMLDADLPLTVGEYEEWGNPQDPQYFAYMLSYSPYDQVRPAIYPNMLISSGWMDYRVGYWEGLKWAQKLRQNNLGNSQIIYLLQKDEGHSGSAGRLQSLWERARSVAWGLEQICP